jgi:hypothetical protein
MKNLNFKKMLAELLNGNKGASSQYLPSTGVGSIQFLKRHKTYTMANHFVVFSGKAKVPALFDIVFNFGLLHFSLWLLTMCAVSSTIYPVSKRFMHFPEIVLGRYT